MKIIDQNTLSLALSRWRERGLKMQQSGININNSLLNPLSR